ncbi:SRP68 [Cordylochernes scorpioides]|uniref:Signal recognition particle subunit SRP68 n=1 Tax=Cordylochernes scorpioides TaxID=51811 RepID=A0ABY6KZ29_9ARAC|nr:SRP68 [Cordylochernes scorpioides]
MVSENIEQKVDEPTEPLKTFTLKILQVIKDAQLQHGLRHGDYQRYRSYCARRLRRLRKSLHFVHGSKHKFQAKKVTTENLKDVRYLHIPLFMAERAWSYSQQLKQESNTEHRKKFHFISKLRKAHAHANDLKELCESSKCDALTNLEAQAYAASMTGLLKFELKDWNPALEYLKKAQAIYQKLAETLTEDESGLYLQRVGEYTATISYCQYNIGDENAMNDLVQLRASGKAYEDEMISMLISQTREKQASTLSEITWMGRTVQVRQEKVRVFLINAKESEKEIESASDIDGKISIYERLLMDCKDALQILNDELKASETKHREGPLSSLAFLHNYITYIKYTKTIDRYLLLIEVLKQNTSISANKKPTKPQDLIRPYEIVIQSLGEILQLSGIDPNSGMKEEIEAKIQAYKAYKCYYIAQTLASANKPLETMAMYQRASSYVTQAANSKSLSAQLKDKLKKLEAEIELNKYSSCANNILGKNKIQDSTVKLEGDKKTLINRLETYYEDPKLPNQPNLAPFPPDFIPIPCKPLFFDLAINHIDFPSLEDKVKQKSTGITGYLSWLATPWKK